MIGRITLLWVGLAAGVAAGLFQVKYEVQALEGRLNRINRAVLADQQAIHVLKAEWSYLNQPTELSKRALALGVLDLKSVAATQIGAVADLPQRRPDSMLASAPQAVPPSEVAKLKGPEPAMANAPGATPAMAKTPLSNPMLASAKQRQ